MGFIFFCASCCQSLAPLCCGPAHTVAQWHTLLIVTIAATLRGRQTFDLFCPPDGSDGFLSSREGAAVVSDTHTQHTITYLATFLAPTTPIS